MNNAAGDPGMVRPWVVCETGHRWDMAVCRFAPAMMPADLVPSVLRSANARTTVSILGDGPAVVLWEAQRDALAVACDQLIQTAIAAPQALQLIAGADLSDRERVVLAELPCAAMIRHPEELPHLAAMIRGHFTKSS